MSIEAHSGTAIDLDKTARDLNSDFQFVADYLPVEVKQGYAGEAFTLAAIAGAGVLWATYKGQRERERRPFDPKSTNPICDFVVTVGLKVDGYDGRLGYTKDFGLTYSTLRNIGPFVDMEHIEAEDLRADDVPGEEAVEQMAATLRALRIEFARSQGIDGANEAAA